MQGGSSSSPNGALGISNAGVGGSGGMVGLGGVGMPGANGSALFSTGFASSGETFRQPSPLSMPQTFTPDFNFQGDGFAGTDPMSLPHVSRAVF